MINDDIMTTNEIITTLKMLMTITDEGEDEYNDDNINEGDNAGDK